MKCRYFSLNRFTIFRSQPRHWIGFNVVEYRWVQLLAILQNTAIGSLGMTLILSGFMTEAITSFYMVVTSLRVVPTPIALEFIILSVNSFVVIIDAFKRLSVPYLKSQEFLSKQKVFSSKDKWFRRFLKSCQEAKLNLGENGFFDRLTSLVIWHFCIDNLITLLLV